MPDTTTDRLRNLHAAYPAETVGEFERATLVKTDSWTFGQRLVQWNADGDAVAITYYETQYAVEALRYSPDRDCYLQLAYIEQPVNTPAQAVAVAHHVMEVASKVDSPTKVMQEWPHPERVLNV